MSEERMPDKPEPGVLDAVPQVRRDGVRDGGKAEGGETSMGGRK